MTTEAPTNGTAVPDVVIRLAGVTMAFGGLFALRDVDLDVTQGERLAVLGPNGAGKTTLFNVVAGDLRPTRGTVVIRGVDCTNRPSRARPGLGVARTYQKTRLFHELTVRNNLYLAQLGRRGRRLALRNRQQDELFRARAAEVAEQVWLGSRVDERVGDLSHGQQRQLEIGMALSTDPDVMMLDEPASGLSRGERERLTEMLEGLDPSMTLLLIEHDMDVALQVAQRVVVLADGSKVAGGSPDEIRHDPVVHEIYLGSGGAA